jgi:hypothetical protein
MRLWQQVQALRPEPLFKRDRNPSEDAMIETFLGMANLALKSSAAKLRARGQNLSLPSRKAN